MLPTKRRLTLPTVTTHDYILGVKGILSPSQHVEVGYDPAAEKQLPVAMRTCGYHTHTQPLCGHVTTKVASSVWTEPSLLVFPLHPIPFATPFFPSTTFTFVPLLFSRFFILLVINLLSFLYVLQLLLRIHTHKCFLYWLTRQETLHLGLLDSWQLFRAIFMWCRTRI